MAAAIGTPGSNGSGQNVNLGNWLALRAWAHPPPTSVFLPRFALDAAPPHGFNTATFQTRAVC